MMKRVDRLYKVWCDEKEGKILENIGDDFYKEMREHINEKISLILREMDERLAKGVKIEDGEIISLLNENIEYDLKKIEEIYKIRNEKIMEKIRWENLNFDGLTEEEKQLYKPFLSARERYKNKTLGKLYEVIYKGYRRMLKLSELYEKRKKTEVLLPHNIKDNILDMLDSVKYSVWVASPWIWGVDFILEKFELLKNNKVDLKVICRPALLEDKAHGSILEKLSALQIPVRFSAVLHTKFLLVDEVEVLFSSANLTQTSLEKNIEHGIRSYDQSIVAQYVNEFERLWVESSS